MRSLLVIEADCHIVDKLHDHDCEHEQEREHEHEQEQRSMSRND